MTPRDAQRAKVYAAEEFVRTLFDRAAEHGNRVVDFFGTQLTLPPEARFGSVQAVQRYVDDVLAHVGSARPLTVRARLGVSAAHYECIGGDAVIAVPDRRTSWAL
ncbi:MAG TPA: TIGR04338 family metallohydrolase, partial [Mycobacterium sp.]|nr:TIGR04338 family metallohydrolase [Mycobacterium sp.]